MKRGNVLLIVIDQIRADVLSGRLASSVPTPNIDRFVSESVTFDNHFTVTVPCGPARASLLTGLYAMNHRSIRNGAPLARHHATIATEARKAGFEPLLFGYTDIPPDPTALDPGDPDLQVYENVARGFREIVEMRLESGREWPAHLLARGYEFPIGESGLPDLYRPVATGAGIPQVRDPAIYSASDSDTAYLTDRTLEALTVRRDRPWFAHLTYIRPHPPFVAPDPYNRLVSPETVPEFLPGCPDHPFVDAWFSTPTGKYIFSGFDGDCAGLPASTIAEVRSVYLGLVAEVDHHVGRVLDWLDATGQRDDTLVVITGDHGEMLGDKRMWGKDSVFEPAYHVPLMIRDPSRPKGAGRRVTAITESVDVTPTILEWIGREPPPAMDGISVTAWLNGDQPEWRDAAFMEMDLGHPNVPTRFQKSWGLREEDCNAAILREGRWKYVHFNGGIPPLLFDLEADPHETTDLAGDASAAGELSRLRSKMLDLRMRRADRRLTGYALGA